MQLIKKENGATKASASHRVAHEMALAHMVCILEQESDEIEMDFFSVPLSSSAVKSLESTLGGPSQGIPQADSMDVYVDCSTGRLLDASGVARFAVGAFCKETIWFRRLPIRWHLAHTLKIGISSVSKTDVAVAMHEVLGVDYQQQFVDVGVSPLSLPTVVSSAKASVVLALSQLSLEQLGQVFRWKRHPKDLFVSMPRWPAAWPKSRSNQLAHQFLFKENPRPQSNEEREYLDSLVDEGWFAKDPWRATEKGLLAMPPSMRLVASGRVLEAPLLSTDLETLESYTKWQLYAILLREGWEHKVLSVREKVPLQFHTKKVTQRYSGTVRRIAS